MRTTVFVVFALIVIACHSPRDPQPPAQVAPAEIAIELDAAMRERLALGVPLKLELRAGERTVGACTLAYDLWDERYQVALSRTDIAHATDPITALRMCLDTEQLAGVREVAIRVREAPHLYQPRADYPVF